MQADWSTKFDGDVRFYQSTELGVLVVGTDNSVYAVDGEAGEVLWRRKNARLDETDVAPIPGTDLVLLNLEKDNRTRVAAVDILTGSEVWQTDRVRGQVMGMAVDQAANLLAVVFINDARGRSGQEVKRKPYVHMFELGRGKELWKHELDTSIEMMPASWNSGEKREEEEVAYTLDNYRPPLFLDNRLYLFYEGVTSYEAQSGKGRLRERFRVNEENLALTDADAVIDEQHIYTSGRGRVRAVSRASGDIEWEAKDFGVTPEIVRGSKVLYVRTGGNFTRLADGETVERGPYGVSAVDPQNGRTLWRYRGADKGLTNLALPDESTILMADRDDLIAVDARTGKRRARVEHKIKQAAFVLINERGQAVVGGSNEIAAFDVRTLQSVWRAKHDPPGRGIFRTVAGIAARAASLYFRYGGTATTVFRGVQLARAGASIATTTLRWSGLAAGSRPALPNLSSLAANLATNSARQYASRRLSSFGVARAIDAARLGNQARGVTLGQLSERARDEVRERVAASIPNVPSVSSVPRPSIDVDERLIDRLDPARQLDRFARFLWRRERLAALRGQWMYFYTDLPRSGNGLAGVDLNTGSAGRSVRLSTPDSRFVTDEAASLLFTADGNRLLARALG